MHPVLDTTAADPLASPQLFRGSSGADCPTDRSVHSESTIWRRQVTG